jgi:hypothetical protein
MTFLQWLEAAAEEYGDFNSGDPVVIPIGKLDTPALKLAFTPGNVDLTIPSGQVFAIPLQGVAFPLPSLGNATLSAGQDSLLIQKV